MSQKGWQANMSMSDRLAAGMKLSVLDVPMFFLVACHTHVNVFVFIECQLANGHHRMPIGLWYTPKQKPSKRMLSKLQYPKCVSLEQDGI